MFVVHKLSNLMHCHRQLTIWYENVLRLIMHENMHSLLFKIFVHSSESAIDNTETISSDDNSFFFSREPHTKQEKKKSPAPYM